MYVSFSLPFQWYTESNGYAQPLELADEAFTALLLNEPTIFSVAQAVFQTLTEQQPLQEGTYEQSFFTAHSWSAVYPQQYVPFFESLYQWSYFSFPQYVPLFNAAGVSDAIPGPAQPCQAPSNQPSVQQEASSSIGGQSEQKLEMPAELQNKPEYRDNSDLKATISLLQNIKNSGRIETQMAQDEMEKLLLDAFKVQDKKELLQHYRKLSLLIHPDKIAMLSNESQTFLKEIYSFLNTYVPKITRQ